MRRWRANPLHHAQERARQARRYYERKASAALAAGASAADDATPRCGICRQLPSVREIVRLKVVPSAPGGYVEVRVPYCGMC